MSVDLDRGSRCTCFSEVVKGASKLWVRDSDDHRDFFPFVMYAPSSLFFHFVNYWRKDLK